MGSKLLSCSCIAGCSHVDRCVYGIGRPALQTQTTPWRNHTQAAATVAPQAATATQGAPTCVSEELTNALPNHEMSILSCLLFGLDSCLLLHLGQGGS
eukprot:461172-Amphidinium_carterae.1